MKKYAYVTFIIRNDSFLPGALVFAYGLRKQKTPHDLVAIVSEHISQRAQDALKLLFDHVVVLDEIFVSHQSRQERQDRPYLFSRFHGLRLAQDGDLGLSYDKVLICDADVLPLRYYDDLFTLNAPAGILNEKKAYCVDDEAGQYVKPKSVYETGTWKWHRVYDALPHGSRIPKAITDRVIQDQTNMGVNASLYLFEPSMRLFHEMMDDLKDEKTQSLIGSFPWPEMQYMTYKMSGKWHNIDLRYSSFNGYPLIDVLYGIHFAGLKPWQMNHRSIKHFAKFEDYRLWYDVYRQMISEYPGLTKHNKLEKLAAWIKELHTEDIYRFKRKNLASLNVFYT